MKKLFILLIVLLIIIVGYFIWFGRADENSTPRFATVARGNIITYIITSGRVESTEQTEIRASLEGLIDTVLVEEGDTVLKGQTLAKFDIIETQNKVNQCNKQVSLTEEELKDAKRELDRSETLLAQAVIPEMQVDATRTKYEIVRIRKKIAIHNLELAQSQLDKLSCVSPQDGVIITKAVDDGEMVIPGQLMLTVANIRKLQVNCNVDEHDVPAVKTGDSAAITFDNLPGESFKGHVKKIYPRAQIEKSTTIVKIEVIFDELPASVKIQVQADVKIFTHEKSNVLYLSPQSVYDKDDKQIVFLYRDGVVREEAVKTGISNNLQIEIVSGLSEGDRVVINREQGRSTGGKFSITK